MTATTDTQEQKARTDRTERLPAHYFGHLDWVSVVIWMLLASIFLFDALTPAENVSVCFAYAIAIFFSLFEIKPRPFLYAGTATILSFAGLLIQPASELTTIVIVANRMIAVATQWLSALLVRVQRQRHDDMQKKAEVQRRFVDILSHEVGTALTTIAGHAFRISKLKDLGAEDLRGRAEKIRKAAERIEAIIDRVQFASSLGDGTIPVGHGQINLHVLIQQLVDHFKDERQNGSIDLHLCDEPQVVRGDEMLLRQMFENVIVNSIKYSPHDARVVIGIMKHGATSRVTIADHGKGIPHYELPRIRDPYYRGENSKGTSGAGLGLYFVERIVEAHKGRLLIESEIAKGTRVVIDLPTSARHAVS